VFSWLCLGSLLTPLNTVIFWIFISQGRARDQMVYGTASALINIATYIIGIHWGLLGVARTSAIASYIVTSPLLVLAASRNGPISKTLLWRSLYPFIISLLGAVIVLELYVRLAHVTGVIDLIALGLIAYGTTLLILCGFSVGRATISESFAIVRSFNVRASG
jgi:polysaccharide transporter, PST family